MTDTLHTPAAVVAPVAAAAGTDPVGTHALGVPAGALPVAQDLGGGTDTSSGALRGEAQPPGPVLEIHTFGLPAPQGSKHGRPIYKGRGDTRVFTGKVALVESSEKVLPWREAVKHAALDAIALREGTGDPFALLGGPLFVYTVYSFIRPAGHYRTGRNAHLLRDNAPAYPIAKRRNDLEKLDRASRDALTDAGVWTDDSLVVHHDSWKVWANEHRDALPVAGAVIRIYSITELSASPSPTSPGR